MNRKILIVWSIWLCLFKFASGQDIWINKLQSGDLIFVGAAQENLSAAINRVTQVEKAYAFDHVGIIEVDQDAIYVLHASSTLGSIRETLHSFVATQQSNSNQLLVFRLKNKYQQAIPLAITKAKELLGKPYNWTYILQENSYYCSDFVERAFRDSSIFSLEPMTFIDPSTGAIDVFWQSYYRKLHLEVPEGQMGCNPNGLAQSKKLAKVGILRHP